MLMPMAALTALVVEAHVSAGITPVLLTMDTCLYPVLLEAYLPVKVTM